MSELRKAAQMALEVLVHYSGDDGIYHYAGLMDAVYALRAALAQPEPVAAAEREACIALLKGIDQTESESDDGWWETSTGAEFGAGILASIRAMGAATRQTRTSDFHSACAGIGLSPNEVERIRCSLAQPEPVLYKWAALFEDPNNDWQAGYEHARRWVLEVGLQSIAAPPQSKPPRYVTYVCPVCAASLERQE